MRFAGYPFKDIPFPRELFRAGNCSTVYPVSNILSTLRVRREMFMRIFTLEISTTLSTRHCGGPDPSFAEIISMLVAKKNEGGDDKMDLEAAGSRI